MASWTEHIVFNSALQGFEHLPFFESQDRFTYMPGAVLYAWIHALTVNYGFFTLHKLKVPEEEWKQKLTDPTQSLWGSRPGIE